jgi:flagellar biosynthetic protein FliQ
MTSEFVLQVGREAIWVACLISLPVLLTGMIVGVLISIFQAVTQIQDQSLSFVPKLVVSILAIVLGGPWLLSKLVVFTVKIVGNLKCFIQ